MATAATLAVAVPQIETATTAGTHAPIDLIQPAQLQQLAAAVARADPAALLHTYHPSVVLAFRTERAAFGAAAPGMSSIDAWVRTRGAVRFAHDRRLLDVVCFTLRDRLSYADEARRYAVDMGRADWFEQLLATLGDDATDIMSVDMRSLRDMDRRAVAAFDEFFVHRAGSRGSGGQRAVVSPRPPPRYAVAADWVLGAWFQSLRDRYFDLFAEALSRLSTRDSRVEAFFEQRGDQIRDMLRRAHRESVVPLQTLGDLRPPVGLHALASLVRSGRVDALRAPGATRSLPAAGNMSTQDLTRWIGRFVADHLGDDILGPRAPAGWRSRDGTPAAAEGASGGNDGEDYTRRVEDYIVGQLYGMMECRTKLVFVGIASAYSGFIVGQRAKLVSAGQRPAVTADMKREFLQRTAREHVRRWFPRPLEDAYRALVGQRADEDDERVSSGADPTAAAGDARSARFLDLKALLDGDDSDHEDDQAATEGAAGEDGEADEEAEEAEVTALDRLRSAYSRLGRRQQRSGGVAGVLLRDANVLHTDAGAAFQRAVERLGLQSNMREVQRRDASGSITEPYVIILPMFGDFDKGRDIMPLSAVAPAAAASGANAVLTPAARLGDRSAAGAAARYRIDLRSSRLYRIVESAQSQTTDDGRRRTQSYFAATAAGGILVEYQPPAWKNVHILIEMAGV